ncbi:MAG: hypothetical protein CMG61_02210 [Candidatus Marinimicrobia bacterium]|nr:hypothetical protein [Candidatus Neomarinimicrobiota bacterium]|tara:strand:- start:7091 stop:7363 length:273 start_codon:yes stop_codon:yes gene_type:complete
MNIKAIQLKKFLEKSDSLYKNIMITSLRARQIIDDRFQDFTIEEDIEDSDQLEELLEDVDYNVAKPISVATSEFMNNELDWRTPEEESDI